MQRSWHYHKVNWGQTNIPIRRTDLDWLPDDLIQNEEDYPIYQFSISGGLGRIAGFWDSNIFHIVLIDPYHNLQPVERYDYALTQTTTALSEYDQLIARVKLIATAQPNCSASHCSTHAALKFVNSHAQSFGILYVDGEYFAKAKELLESGKAKSIEDILAMGVLYLSEGS